MRYPSDIGHVFAIDVRDSLVYRAFEQMYRDSLEVAITNFMDMDKEDKIKQT